MKLLHLFVAFVFSGIALHAQDCTHYYPMKTGVKMELTGYDQKDRKISKLNYEILDATSTYAKVKGQMYDKDDELFKTIEFDLKCENGTFMVDMSSMMPTEQLEAFKNMDVDIETSFLSYPGKLKVGQTLPDGSFTISIKSNGATIMTMKTSVINRKVESMEEVTTPAGTFMCYKISEETVMDMGMAKTTTKSINWISERVGVVKAESYNKKGKLDGTTLLTAISGL